MLDNPVTVDLKLPDKSTLQVVLARRPFQGNRIKLSTGVTYNVGQVLITIGRGDALTPPTQNGITAQLGNPFG